MKTEEKTEKTAEGSNAGVRRFVLDMSKVKKEDLPERFKGLRLIPLVEGQYESDYDVVMDELPPDVAKSCKELAAKMQPHRNRPDWPLGIDESHVNRMPEGAFIRFA